MGSTVQGNQVGCDNCPLGQYQNNQGQTACINCDAGSYNDDASTPTLQCILCEAGNFQVNAGSVTCDDQCDPGELSLQGAAICTICPAVTYNPLPGQEFCPPCPGGSVSNPGSIDVIQCVNPLSNFIIGYIVLFGTILFVFPYIYLGRFHRASFLREQRNLIPFERMMNYFDYEFLKLVFWYTEFEKLKLSMKYHGTKLRRNVRLSLFIFFGTVLTISVVMIAYILALSKILYNSLLVFRGINADLDVKVFYENLMKLLLYFMINCI